MPFLSPEYLSRLNFLEYRSLASSHVKVGWHPDTQDELYVPNKDRYAGTYILGVQGAGKSGLLHNLIKADMDEGQAVIVIDAHKDLLDACLHHVPAERLPHIYLLDMEDEAYPFGVNLFNTGKITSDVERTQAVSRIMHIFEILWPEVMTQQNLPRYLLAAALVFLANPGTTLVDMHAFLLDQSVRYAMLKNVTDSTVTQFWHTQYDNLGPHEQYRRVQPLIGRLEALFMGRSLVRNIVGQQRTTINFRKAIEQKQIIFIKLPIKTVAQDARLIGTILLSQIHAAVFSFADIPETQRPGVSLYVDEFQHFATSDFSELLTEGRKFGVRVTVAHQYRGQLPPFLQGSTMTARTKVCFSLTPEDGREMAHVFPSSESTIKPEDIEHEPVSYLLTHPSNDHFVRLFTETYLHPMKEHKRRGGRLDVDGYRYDYVNGREVPSRQVIDPTVRLNNLLYETMRESNPSLPIPREVVLGFSTCGYGFYGIARGLAHDDFRLRADFPFPKHLVGEHASGMTYWTRRPESAGEQLLHFIFHLRMAMIQLATRPIGKVTTTGPAEVAKMLSQLPRRAAFVRSGDTVGVIYTHNTGRPLEPAEYAQRVQLIQQQTRAMYCHPRPDSRQPAESRPVLQPVSRWEVIE